MAASTFILSVPPSQIISFQSHLLLSSRKFGPAGAHNTPNLGELPALSSHTREPIPSSLQALLHCARKQVYGEPQLSVDHQGVKITHSLSGSHILR